MIAPAGFSRKATRAGFIRSHDDVHWDGRHAWVRMDAHEAANTAAFRFGLFLGVVLIGICVAIYFWIQSL